MAAWPDLWSAAWPAWWWALPSASFPDPPPPRALPMPSTPDLTLVLNAACEGDDRALGHLAAAVYAQLRALAARQMVPERADHTLQPTALVHEAYLRLFVGQDVRWESRGHFFAAAANAMRRILIEDARRRRRLKRGGGRRRVQLDAVEPMAALAGGEEPELLLDLDEALKRLEKLDPRKSQVVMLRYFAGLSVLETAEILDVSSRTVEAEWSRARAWLYDAVRGSSGGEGDRDGEPEDGERRGG